MSSEVYIVLIKSGIDSVHASMAAAKSRASKAKEEGEKAIKVVVHELLGGRVTFTEDDDEAGADESEDLKMEVEKSKPSLKAAATVGKSIPKTQTPAEQRARNSTWKAGSGRTKKDDEDLPENVQELLAGEGNVLIGKLIVVTGVPPLLGRKNAEMLVQKYGGKLGKSITKTTDFVVVGNEAGPKKLEKIEELGLENMDETAFIELLEGAPEEEEPPAKKVKRAARAKK